MTNTPHECRLPVSATESAGENASGKTMQPRRAFLKSGLTAAGVVSLLESSQAMAWFADKQKNMKQGFIDAHVHVWDSPSTKYPLTAGFRRGLIAPPTFTPEHLLKLARASGVDRIVLIQMSFYGFDNAYMLDTIERFPGRFSGVAVIDNNQPRPDDQMRKLKSQGVRGFRIYSRNRPFEKWLDGEGMARMWKCGAEEGQAMCGLVDTIDLPAIDRMCEKHPDTTMVIDHFARIGVDGEIRKKDVDLLCRLARHRNTKVKVSAFYALGKKKPPYLDLLPMIRRLLDAYGPERLMWATDCPFQVDEHSYEDSIALVRDRCDFLSDGDRDWLLRKTAEQTFFS